MPRKHARAQGIVNRSQVVAMSAVHLDIRHQVLELVWHRGARVPKKCVWRMLRCSQVKRCKKESALRAKGMLKRDVK